MKYIFIAIFLIALVFLALSIKAKPYNYEGPIGSTGATAQIGPIGSTGATAGPGVGNNGDYWNPETEKIQINNDLRIE